MGKIKIYPKNILEDAAVSATGTPDTGFPESRLYDRAISLYWKLTGTQATDFVADQGASGNVACDFLAIHRHNFNGKDMQWQWSTDNFVSDINDAVADWTQGDNHQIVKTLGSALTKRYWRLTLASMTNPYCGEIWMGPGYEFDVLADPDPELKDIKNVQWNKTVGDIERSTKFGAKRRSRLYAMSLSTADLASFQTAMAYLSDYSLPFYFKDHAGNYFLARLLDEPVEKYYNKTNTLISISLIELL